MDHPSPDITQLLRAWGSGDAEALDRLTTLVYDELHRLAQRYMRRENGNLSLQTTALVNEAYLRLVNLQQVSWQDRAHFFAISANLMRRILVDAARARSADKRGGLELRMVLNESIDAAPAAPLPPEHFILLNDAIDALTVFDARKAKVVELRFFSGLTIEETAEVLNISGKQVKRDWNFSRAWLMRKMKSNR